MTATPEAAKDAIRRKPSRNADARIAEVDLDFRALVEASLNSILVLQDERIIYANPAAVEMLGYAKDELLGMRFLEVVHPDFRDTVKEYARKRLRGEAAAPRIEIRIVGKGGRGLWNDAFTSRIEYGGRPAVLVTAVDITEWKQAEDALGKLRAGFEKSQEIAHLGSWELDLLSNRLSWSNQVYRIFGLRPREFGATYEAFLSFVHPDDRAAVDAAYTNSVREGRDAYEIEHRIVRKSTGEVRFVHEKCEHVRDGSGRIIRSMGMVHDITERKQAEEALKTSEKFLNSVLDSIQDGISVLDRDLNIIRVNHVLEEWHPYMIPLRGKKCYYTYHGRSAPCEVCPSIRAIRTGTAQSDIVPLHGESNELKGWLEIFSFPMIDDNGNVTGVIEYVRDITGRKRAEDALQDARDQAELYLDLMSHDINNMHQIALGYLELARGTPRETGRDEFLDKSVEVLQRSARLIQNVRKLQKFSDGPSRSQTVDLCQVLADIQRAFGAVPQKAITLDLSGCDHCYVRANEFLADVFANLVSNAIKHTGDAAEIAISLDTREDGGSRHFRVAVEDTGPGIPDDFKDKIFNRLLKGTSKAKGMGLGLYLVKSLVDSYGGRVWVEDRVPGDYTKGARFVVTLPAANSRQERS